MAATLDGCAADMAQVAKFCIDRYEAHLVRRAEGGRIIRHPYYERPLDGVTYEARSAPGVFPQAYISRVEAAAACQAAGKRLCGWLEWRRACQGKSWHRYPYGWQGVAGRCNTGKAHLLPLLFDERDRPKGWTYEHFNSPKLALEPGYLAKTGAYRECKTDTELYDLVGNLHEWVSTMVTESFIERMEAERVERLEQPWVVGNGMFLGGFYSTTSEHGPGCHFTTVAHEPTYHDYSTGFRCCRDAPTTQPSPAARAR